MHSSESDRMDAPEAGGLMVCTFGQSAGGGLYKGVSFVSCR